MSGLELTQPRSFLFVTAHRAEGAALAAAIHNCKRGPVPFSHSGKNFKLLVAGAPLEKFQSTLENLDLSGFTNAVLFGAAGGLTEIPILGNMYNCSPVVLSNGKSLSFTVSISLTVLPIAAAEKPLIDPESRDAFLKKTGAHLVDMESETFASFFSGRNISWAIVRFVSDTPSMPFDFPFPKMIQEKMRIAGKSLADILKIEPG